MTDWITDRLPAHADADLHGQVRWGPHLPGFLSHYTDVRPGEPWQHSSAWSPPPIGVRPDLSGSQGA